ncbi:unnamed protein product [Periconia digitata]|uniref:Secreted protein n=1 Tax=Periconia digitata TaxID=1303443 RepID=A0A9W4UQW5_9PLEO|nr:unnamed protein product [Periconia digitata]
MAIYVFWLCALLSDPFDFNRVFAYYIHRLPTWYSVNVCGERVCFSSQSDVTTKSSLMCEPAKKTQTVATTTIMPHIAIQHQTKPLYGNLAGRTTVQLTVNRHTVCIAIRNSSVRAHAPLKDSLRILFFARSSTF